MASFSELWIIAISHWCRGVCMHKHLSDGIHVRSNVILDGNGTFFAFLNIRTLNVKGRNTYMYSSAICLESGVIFRPYYERSIIKLSNVVHRWLSNNILSILQNFTLSPLSFQSHLYTINQSLSPPPYVC